MADTIIVMQDSGGPDIPASRDRIAAALAAGASAQDVAAQLGLDPATVLQVADEQQVQSRQGAAGTDKLHGMLRDLDEIIEIAKWQARAEPVPPNVYAYVALVETARGLLQDIDGRRDPRVLRDELVDRVLRALVSQVIAAMTSRLAATRAALLEITPAGRHAEVALQVEGVMRALGAVLSDELGAATSEIDKLVDERPKTALARRRPGGR